MNKIREKSNLKVLMYHRIVPDSDLNKKGGHAVSEKNFSRQIKMLDWLNYTPITFEDYKLFLDGELTLPKKPIILTFDDGHCDTFDVARPILQDFGMKAVIFVMGNRELKNAFWDQEFYGDGCPLMTNEQILSARDEGFEIGAHTMNHPKLDELDDYDVAREIIDSKYSIENLLGHEVLSFAYPYGKLDKRVYRTVKECGFRFSCGVYTGPPSFGDDFTEIRRLAITSETTLLAFLIKILFPYQYVEWLYGKWHHGNINERKESARNAEAAPLNYKKREAANHSI